MDSREALNLVEEMVQRGELIRVSSAERTTKAIIFKTLTGRNFAVEINDTQSRNYAVQVKLVFERAPGGVQLDWPSAASKFDGQLNDLQFQSSALQTKGSNLEPGKQMSVVVRSPQSLQDLIAWYAVTHHAQIANADKIRAHALARYILPARQRGESSVTILASKIHNDLGLSKNFPNVDQALTGKIFLKQCNLSTVQRSGAAGSSATTFTYHFENQAIPMPQKSTIASNLILYGPPGTGKTYASAAEAVRLCLGEAQAAPLLVPEQREALMLSYRDLVAAGRIDFVTFHQSYSYEDFVEGLRPTTEMDDGSLEPVDETRDVSTSGFRLRCEDGIFKRICERARLDRGSANEKTGLDRQRRIFKVSLGRRGQEEDRISDGLDNNLVHLGWGGDIDWSPESFDNFDAIKREWNTKKDPGATGKDSNIEMIFSLRSDMQVGDYIVLSDGRDAIRAVGKVTGHYYYDASASYHPHRREVEWLWQDVAGVRRDVFYKKFFRQHAIYRLNRDIVDWDGLEEIVFGKTAQQVVTTARPYVLVIDEINRANISKVFGELITLLEPDKRLGETNEIRVQLPYSGRSSFGVPSNLHIIGTMNTADRSIALLDTALRRRFKFRELMPQPSLLSRVDGVDLAKVLATLNERIEFLFDREHQIGHAYFIGCQSRQDIEEVMRHKVIPLLAEYFYEDWNKVAAVLGDAKDGENYHSGGFLKRERLVCPPGMGSDDEAPIRFRWSVQEKFDFSKLVSNDAPNRS
ncbi:AAA family ATPase [Massilia sp. YIM B02443]|uniref:AAA family ATPase n=1 Tax=Massilia sp. YIM B02443 TaxID=3050127 RepID=UPI0025B70A9D|nr:AAA family ATPase [Massilia sp. YIM B02443]MDN4039800.1 AAA family ATPase [Massilia sp. YIM B02443]